MSSYKYCTMEYVKTQWGIHPLVYQVTPNMFNRAQGSIEDMLAQLASLYTLQHQDNSTEHLYACNVLKTMIFTSIVSPRIPTYNLLYTKSVTLIAACFIPQQYIMHGIANESGSSCNENRVTNLKGQSPCML